MFSQRQVEQAVSLLLALSFLSLGLAQITRPIGWMALHDDAPGAINVHQKITRHAKEEVSDDELDFSSDANDVPATTEAEPKPSASLDDTYVEVATWQFARPLHLKLPPPSSEDPN